MKIGNLNSSESMQSFLIDLDTYGKAIMEEKISSGMNPINFIEVLVRFMRKFLEVRKKRNYYFAAVKNRRKRSNSDINIEITCLDPRETTNFVYEESFATINCSGTIHPDSFKEIMGFTEMKKKYGIIELLSPFSKKNIKVLITENVNTKAVNRTDKTYAKMCKKIAEIIFNTPANVGIFCASYTVLEALIKNGIKDLIKFSGKKFFQERGENSASDNAILIEKFKKESNNNGAVLLGVSGGRNSEGEDFPGDFMNAVIVVGFPFAKPTPRIEAKINYYNALFQGKGRLYAYTIPAIRRSNQAAGRPIRKLTDKGAIILMDDRFKYYIKLVSPWIRENAEIVEDRPNTLAILIERFFD
jgi:DNA excision repair protein ERCC-2